MNINHSVSGLFYNMYNWLNTENPIFNNRIPYLFKDTNMYISSKTLLCDKIEEKKENIYLFQQFYVDKNANRHKENQTTLYINVNNKQISKIFLLNERIYTHAELGITSNKIQQVNINTRLKYSDVFNYIYENKIKGYILLCNSDIFYDNTLESIYRTNLVNNKKVFCQLRHEYINNTRLSDSKLFDQIRPNSQDAWIWHSSLKLNVKQIKLINFHLGIPGCDNKIIYLLNLFGIKCHNEPKLLKIFHLHNSNIRNYNNKTKSIEPIYTLIFPLLEDKENIYSKFNIIKQNNNLFNYIENKLKNNKQFILPKIQYIENDFVMYAFLYKKKLEKYDNNNFLKLQKYMNKTYGINILNLDIAYKYADKYLSAFTKCDTYFWYSPMSNYGKIHDKSNKFIENNFKKNKVDMSILEIYNNIYNNPWTLALKGKRILIISNNNIIIKKQINLRKQIYGIDLFPNCKFIFLDTPDNTNSFKFNILLNIKDDFDIALCGTNCYDNIICSYLLDIGKSSISVGNNLLELYFGIYSQKWVRTRNDVFNLFMNKNWVQKE